jgi:hypothetical protein
VTTVKMQRPSGGCQNCGGAVRTYKPNGVGWVCSECARRLLRPDGGWPGHPVRSRRSPDLAPGVDPRVGVRGPLHVRY